MTEIVQHESPRELALYFQKSGLFPDLRSEAQAYVKIVAGRELGLGPLASVSGLNVIKGRVTFSANLLASMVKRHPAYDYRVTDHSDELCRIVFLEDGQEIGTSEFTLTDAKRAGLGGNSWSRYPKAMLFARALTQGVRWFCPDVTAGAPAYSPEELEEPSSSQIDAAPSVGGAWDRLNELGALVDDYEMDEEQRATLRKFVSEGGGQAIDTAIRLLEDGNPRALFAGIAHDSETVEGEVVP